MARTSRKKLQCKEVQACACPKQIGTALYVRLSVEDARKKNCDSVANQKAILLEYLARQPDLALYKVYEDVNYTGTNFARPAFEAMMKDAYMGRIGCIVAKDLSRLGRSFIETGHYIERVFPSIGIRFIAVNDGYDTLSATADDTSLTVPLKNLINEIYAHDISRKTQLSYRLKQRRGEFCGSFAPYGYVKLGSALVVEPEAACVVRQIFTWSLQGLSDTAIAKRLAERKVYPPARYRYEKGITKEATKASRWHKSAIKRIVENPAYTGALVQGKQVSNFLRGGGREERPADQWLVFDNAHEAIVDKATFHALQVLRRNRQSGGRGVA